MKTIKRKSVSNTWCGREANSYETYLEQEHLHKTFGLRIVVRTWLDNGECIINLVDGAGGSMYWKEYEHIVLDDPTDQEVDEVVAKMIKNAENITDTFYTQGVGWANQL
ncbi:hypothetical protein D3C78_19840 [compost metagenome]